MKVNYDIFNNLVSDTYRLIENYQSSGIVDIEKVLEHFKNLEYVFGTIEYEINQEYITGGNDIILYNKVLNNAYSVMYTVSNVIIDYIMNVNEIRGKGEYIIKKTMEYLDSLRNTEYFLLDEYGCNYNMQLIETPVVVNQFLINMPNFSKCAQTNMNCLGDALYFNSLIYITNYHNGEENAVLPIVGKLANEFVMRIRYIKQRRMMLTNRVKNYIIRNYKKYKYIIIPVHIRINENSTHANMLFIDTINKTIELIEPQVNYNDPNLLNRISDYFETEIFNTDNQMERINLSTLSHNTFGTTIQDNQELYTYISGGFCASWALFIVHTRLRNSHIYNNPNDFYMILTTYLFGLNPVKLTEFIRRYTFFLSSNIPPIDLTELMTFIG